MCRFNIRFEGDRATIKERVNELIQNDGGVFSATDSLAEFSVRTPVGRIDGTCVWIDAVTIGVTITKKPFFVPCSTVRDRMVAALVAASETGDDT